MYTNTFQTLFLKSITKLICVVNIADKIAKMYDFLKKNDDDWLYTNVVPQIVWQNGIL